MTNADSYPSVNLGYGSCPSSSPTRFPKTATFPVSLVREKIMGPNPLKLCEELLTGSDLPHGSRVCDLGSGTGITSALLAREYGLDVYAVDLWSDPAENRAFFDSLGTPVSSIHPVKADASRGLPFCAGFFDAVVSIDSYNYYGRDSRYLDERLLPYVRTGGELHLSIPGMVHDCHDDLPSCLLASWTPEQLEYMHDMAWWKRMLGQSPGAPSSRPVPSNSPEKLDERHTTSETLTIETTPPPDISSATVGSAGVKPSTHTEAIWPADILRAAAHTSAASAMLTPIVAAVPNEVPIKNDISEHMQKTARGATAGCTRGAASTTTSETVPHARHSAVSAPMSTNDSSTPRADATPRAHMRASSLRRQPLHSP